MNRAIKTMRLWLAFAAAAVLLAPELADAKVRGTTRSFSATRAKLKARGRIRGVRARRAKPNRVRVRRMIRRKTLVRKLLVRKRSDINESELGAADSLRTRGKAGSAKDRKAKKQEEVFGPQ